MLLNKITKLAGLTKTKHHVKKTFPSCLEFGAVYYKKLFFKSDIFTRSHSGLVEASGSVIRKSKMWNSRTMKIAVSSSLFISGIMLSLVRLSEQRTTEKSLKTGKLNFNTIFVNVVKFLIFVGVTNESHLIELGLVLDNALYQQFDQDDDQAKLYIFSLVKQSNALLRPINVSVHLVYVTMWKDHNEIPIINDTVATLTNFQTFVRNIDVTKANLDTVILLSGFRDLDMPSAAYLRSICKQTPSAAVVRIDTVQSRQNAAVVVHEIGHLLGAEHDHKCRGCVMSPFIDDWSDEGWSRRSQRELVEVKEEGLWKCLRNKPSKVDGWQRSF